MFADKFGRTSICASLLGVVTLVVAGCAPQTNDGGPSVTDSTVVSAEVPEESELTFRWIDTDVVDLLSADGTFVRAAAESWELARYNEDLDAGYPGFADAMHSATYDFEGLGRSPEETVIGTIVFQIVAIDELRNGVTQVWYCGLGNLAGTTMNLHPDAPGRYEVGNGSETSAVIPLLYRRTPGVDGVETLPPSGMQGRREAPSGNVFGSWSVVATNIGADTSLEPSVDECEKKAPGTPEDWGPGVQYSDTPPVAQPPYPGWPANAA